MTQPLDVLKTRAMNAKPGEFKVRRRGVYSTIWKCPHVVSTRYFTCLFSIPCRIWCIWSRTRPDLDLWDFTKVTSRPSFAWHHKLFWPSCSLSSFVNTLDTYRANEMFDAMIRFAYSLVICLQMTDGRTYQGFCPPRGFNCRLHLW